MESSNKVVESSEIQDHILPHDIVENIFSRLPVKSLFRFRCASKSYCYLIGNKSFIQAHLKNSRKNPTLARHRIIMTSYAFSYPPGNRLRHCSLPSLMNDPCTCTYAFDDAPMRTSYGSYDIVGSCHGLICFMLSENKFLLWNPSTRLWNKLPDFKLEGGFIWRCGFGFDERNGDYKIVVALEFRRQPRKKMDGRIYSLNSNSWTEINMPELDDIKNFQVGVFVNGKIHWLKLSEWKWQWEAVWFDLESMQHGIVQLPGSMPDTRSASLVEVEGCLGMVGANPDRGMNVWIMKEYGVKESWSKVRSISCDWDNWEWHSLIFQLIYMGETGELLSLCQYKILVSNLKDSVFRKCSGIVCNPYIYLESLVSPLPVDKRTVTGEHE